MDHEAIESLNVEDVDKVSILNVSSDGLSLLDSISAPEPYGTSNIVQIEAPQVGIPKVVIPKGAASKKAFLEMVTH